MISRLSPITGFGLVARDRNTALVVLATDDRADGIIEAWRRSTTAPSPLDDFSRHLDGLAGPPPPLAMVSVTDRDVRFVACGGMEISWHGPVGHGSAVEWTTISAASAPERHTLTEEVWTLKVAAVGASTHVDPRTHLESGVVHAAGFNLGVSPGAREPDDDRDGDPHETASHVAVPVDGTDDITASHEGLGASDDRDAGREAVESADESDRRLRRSHLLTPVAGSTVDPVRVDPLPASRHRAGLYSPPPPAIVAVEHPPASEPPSGTSGRILLIDAPAPALSPLPLADVASPAAPTSTDDAPSDMVLGIRCTRDHLNDPDAYYCAQCGIAMVHLTHKLSEGRRPSLGFLVFDDGTAFTVDSEYVIGRAPHDDARVDEGAIRPLTIDDRTRTVSRVHADIKLEGWHVFLVDRNSTNGCYLWDESSQTWVRLPPGVATRLAPGAHAAIGQRVFHFESPHEQRV